MHKRNWWRVRLEPGFFTSALGLTVAGILLGIFVIALGVYSYFWFSYGRMIDQRLGGHVNPTTARIYTAPTEIFTGESLPESRLVEDLQRSGYSASKGGGAPGWFAMQGNAVEVHPEQESYFAGKNALRVEFAGNVVQAHTAAR